MRQYNFNTVLFKQIQPHLFQGSKNTIKKKKKGKHNSFLVCFFRNQHLHGGITLNTYA